MYTQICAGDDDDERQSRKKTDQGVAVVTAVKKRAGDLSDLCMHQDREEVEEIVIYVGAAGAAEYTSACIWIRIGGCMPGRRPYERERVRVCTDVCETSVTFGMNVGWVC